MDRALTRLRWQSVPPLAARQKGLVARYQLLRLGVPGGTIDEWVRARLLHVVHPGVYLVGHTVMAAGADRLAAVMACGAQALLSHRSAAESWGMVDPRPGFALQVTVPGDGIDGPRGVRLHRTLAIADDERDIRDGIPVTSAARTVFDFASQASPFEVAGAYELGLIEGYFTRDDMIGMAMRHKGRRGIRKIRLLIDRDAPPSVTIERAHRMLLELIRTSQLPHPKTEFPIGKRRADICWPEAKLVVEMDGGKWHNSPGRIEQDKRRDAELAALGYLTIRVTWNALTKRPAEVVSQIAAAYATRAPSKS